MSRLGHFARAKAVESMKKHPKPWVVGGMILAVTLGGTAYSATHGEFNQPPTKDRSAAEEPANTDSRSPNTETAHKKVDTKKTLAGVACATVVQTSRGKSTLTIALTKGKMPRNASMTYRATYSNDPTDERGGGADQGDTSIALPSNHGRVLNAQGTIHLKGNTRECTIWKTSAASVALGEMTGGAQGGDLIADNTQPFTPEAPAPGQGAVIAHHDAAAQPQLVA